LTLSEPIFFYLRDRPQFDPTKQKSARGRPVVCIAAQLVENPEEEIPAGYSRTEAACWLHFCLSACSPLDVSGPFSRKLGREIALGRLAKRKYRTTRTVHNYWRNETEVHSTQIGLTIPLSSSELTGRQIKREVLTRVSDPIFPFAPTARKMAGDWLQQLPGSAASLPAVPSASIRVYGPGEMDDVTKRQWEELKKTGIGPSHPDF
jgi:hypothetical protein